MKVGILIHSFRKQEPRKLQKESVNMKEIMKEKATRQYILFLSFFTVGAMITSGTYVTFLQEHRMSLFQVNLVNTTYFLTLFLCEIPTGAFADIFGRRRAFITACVLRGLGSLIYGLSQTFWGFVLAEVIAAIGFTFMSGALKAWFVDSIIHRGHESPTAKVFGRVKFYSQMVGMLSCVIGSYLAVWSMKLPWFVGALTEFVVAVLAYLTMREEYFVHKEFSFKKGFLAFKSIVASSLHYGATDKAVRFILLATFIQIFAVQPFNMYWQPFFGSHGVEKVNFGWIFFSMIGCLAIGSLIAAKAHAEGKEKSFIVRSQVFVGVLVLMAVVSSNLWVTLFLFLVHELGRGFWEPMKDAYLHKRIPSHERATIDSFCSISPHIGGAFGLVFSGAVAQSGGIPLAWTVSALILIVSALVISRNGYHQKS